MVQPYKAFTFTISPVQPGSDILIAELSEAGFESFLETETGIQAFIPVKEYHPELLSNVNVFSSDEFKIEFTSEDIQQVNWNEAWEKNFKPITVGKNCQVRAPFHPKKEVDFDIIIEPKMSFGTGHHATTHLMIQFLLEENLQGKRVLDMGCGTGVLAILAAKKKAAEVKAIDIDHWCYLNTQENIERNNCPQITVEEGGAELLAGKKFDCILANINRNILLEDLPVYVNSLRENGQLFLSGFFLNDLSKIKERAQDLELSYQTHLEREDWIAVKFVK